MSTEVFRKQVRVMKVRTRYNQSVTGCRSQRRQCSCYSMKSRVNSMILILKLNLTSLRNINIILIKSGLRWAPHTFLCICFSMKSNSNWGLDHAIYISFHWVTTTCLRWEPQPVTLWLYPVIRGCLYGLCPKATGALSVLKKWVFLTAHYCGYVPAMPLPRALCRVNHFELVL